MRRLAAISMVVLAIGMGSAVAQPPPAQRTATGPL